MVSDVSQCKQTDSRLMSEMNMEKSLQQEFSALEDFSSARLTHTPEDGVLEDVCVSGALALVFEDRGDDCDGEPQDFSYT